MPGISLEDGATQSLVKAMSGLATRQRVISNNLANIDTPGFKSSEVTFATALENAQSGSGTLRLAATNAQHIAPAALSDGPQIVVKSTTSQRVDGNNVDMEKEMESLSETVLHFQTAARVVSRRLGMLRTVISGGTR